MIINKKNNNITSLCQIKRDLYRTYPELKFFHNCSGNVLHQPVNILYAYILMRPDIGYDYSCDTIGATVIKITPNTFIVTSGSLLPYH